MDAHIETSRDDRVLTVRFARPEKRNAITLAMYEALAHSLAAAESDETIRVVAFLGSDGIFTAGNDIRDFLDSSPQGFARPVLSWLHALATFPKPLVAGVDGDAVGIGTTMLLHCDVVLATASARLRLPFVDLGLVPEAASSLLLPRLVGHVRAAELLMLAEPFDGRRAVDLGIANRLVDAGSLEAETLALAHRLAVKPARAVQATKALLRRDVTATLSAIEAEADMFARLLASPEAREAFAAFLDRRAPGASRTP